MRLKKNLFYNLLFILSFFILSLLSILIMVHSHFIAGGFDSYFHFGRIMELKESLKNFTLPQFSFNYFHGSAVMTLYPYLNLLPIIFLSYLIKDKIILFYLFIGVYFFISFLTSFFGSIKFSKSWRISYLFSIIYVMSNLYMYYSFGSMDIGVVSSLAWLPLIIFGFINLVKSSKNNWIELSIGITLTIFSHVLTTIMIIILLFFWLVVNYRKINSLLIINVFKATILTILSTTIVWLPALSFNKFNSIVPPTLAKLSGSPISSLIKSDWTSYGFSLIALIGFVLGFILYKIFTSIERQMYVISIITIFICSNFFPWNYLPNILSKYLSYFQMTSRFLVIPQLMLSYLTAVSVIKTFHNKNIILIIISLLSIGLQIQNQYFIVNNNINNPQFNRNFINTNTKKYGSKNQFNSFMMPLKTSNSTNIFTTTPNYKLINNRNYYNLVNPNTDYFYKDYDPKISDFYDEVQSNKGIIGSHYINVFNCGFNKFKFTNNKSGKIIMPIFYYNHENISAYVDNKKVNINHDKGVIQTGNIKKGHHILRIVLYPSYHIKFSILLTIIGFICYIFVIITLFLKKYFID